MSFIKIATALILSQTILACSTLSEKSQFISSEKNSSYDFPISSMGVYIDVSVIGVAGANIKNIAQEHSDASKSLVNSFKVKMSEARVNVLVKPFGTVTYTVKVEGPKTTTSLKRQGIGNEEMIAGESSNFQPILIVRIGSTQAINNVWNGMVSWNLELVDPSVWTSKNKTTIWKGETKPMQFSPSYCSGDAYKSCADRFSELVITQLRSEKIIK
jgi:hypothetical protein